MNWLRYAALPIFLIIIATLACFQLSNGTGKRKKRTSMFRQVLPSSAGVERTQGRLLAASNAKWDWIVDGGQLQRIESAS